MQEIPENVKKL